MPADESLFLCSPPSDDEWQPRFGDCKKKLKHLKKYLKASNRSRDDKRSVEKPPKPPRPLTRQEKRAKRNSDRKKDKREQKNAPEKLKARIEHNQEKRDRAEAEATANANAILEADHAKSLSDYDQVCNELLTNQPDMFPMTPTYDEYEQTDCTRGDELDDWYHDA
jgi:hypothetical protein